MFSQGINVHSPIFTPPREILIKEFPSRALTALSSINNKRESYATSKSNFRALARPMINDFGRWYWWTAARELRIIAPAIGSCFQLPRIINLVVSDCAYFLKKMYSCSSFSIFLNYTRYWCARMVLESEKWKFGNPKILHLKIPEFD